MTSTTVAAVNTGITAAAAVKKKLQKLVKLYFEVEAFKKKKIQPDNFPP